MTIGTRINSTAGVVSTNNSSGVQVVKDGEHSGFAPFKVNSVTAITSSQTLTANMAGVLTFSGSAALTGTLPTAASAVGSEFIIRTLSAHAHLLTASQDTGSTITASGSAGTRITMGAVVGNSVVLKCDGVNWFLTSFKGLTVVG